MAVREPMVDSVCLCISGPAFLPPLHPLLGRSSPSSQAGPLVALLVEQMGSWSLPPTAGEAEALPEPHSLVSPAPVGLGAPPAGTPGLPPRKPRRGRFELLMPLWGQECPKLQGYKQILSTPRGCEFFLTPFSNRNRKEHTP